MRLFVYGSLLDAARLAARGGDPALRRRGSAATLHGWRRVGLPHAPWPALRRHRTGVVTGALVDVTAAAARRLSAYEGPGYHLRPVVVATASGKTVAARVWIAPGATRRPWKE